MAVETVETQLPPATTAHTVVHVEIPAKDAGTLQAFYAGVFGWTFASSEGMDSYKMARTGNGPESVSVAIYPRPHEAAPMTNYISVESVQAYADKIERLGGKILHRFTVTGMGHGAMAVDPESNPLGIWQYDPSAVEAAA